MKIKPIPCVPVVDGDHVLHSIAPVTPYPHVWLIQGDRSPIHRTGECIAWGYVDSFGWSFWT